MREEPLSTWIYYSCSQSIIDKDVIIIATKRLDGEFQSE